MMSASRYSLIFLIFLFNCWNFSCASKKPSASESSNTPEVISTDSVTAIRAKVVVKYFVDKAGREHQNITDFYLLFNTEEYFVRFSESKILRSQLEPLKGKECEFRVIFKDGLWDSDNPAVQSRVGKYVGIVEIVGR